MKLDVCEKEETADDPECPGEWCSGCVGWCWSEKWLHHVQFGMNFHTAGVFFFVIVMFCSRGCRVLQRSQLLQRKIIRVSTVANDFVSANEAKASKTVRDMYQQSVKDLQSKSVSDPEESSRHIISHVCALGTRYSDFNRSLDRLVTPSEYSVLQNLLQRRMQNEPIQYIIGNWDFYGRTFICRPPTLIPRPETEELVELIDHSIRNDQRYNILDIGSGTGAIGISLIKALSIRCSSMTGIDISASAVALSIENAARLLTFDEHSRYVCLHSSLQNLSQCSNHYQRYDIIVSNPPYIPSKDIASLQPEIVQFEDPGALDGGDDGLDIVRDLLRAALYLLSPQGPGEIWLEVSHEHPNKIRQLTQFTPHELLEQDRIFSEYDCIAAISDLSGNPRFVHLKRKSSISSASTNAQQI